jgi:hypothetical protein
VAKNTIKIQRLLLTPFDFKCLLVLARSLQSSWHRPPDGPPAEHQGVSTMTARFASLHQTVAVSAALLLTAALVLFSTPVIPVA